MTSGAARSAKSAKPASWMKARSVEYKRRIIDPMSIDALWIFLSLIPGGVGFVLFVYGKKQGRWGMVVAGLVFMVYPYFTETITSLIVVGVLLGAVTWAGIREGW
jgi:hypothetical protein